MRPVLVLLILVAIWVVWRRINEYLYNDAFSPLSLLFYFWVAPFILSFANLSGLQSGVTGFAITVISVSTLLLCLTCILPALLRKTRGPHLLMMNKAAPTEVKLFWVFGFYIATMIALYFAEFHGRDLPLLNYVIGDASDSNLNTQGKDSKLQFVAAGTTVGSTFLFYLWLTDVQFWRRALFLTLSLLVVILGFAKSSKSDVFIPVLCFAALHYYHHRERRTALPLRYITAAILLIPLTISLTSIRLDGVGLVGGYAGLIDFKYTDELGSVLSEILSIAYGYTALAFQNFSNYVETHDIELRLGASLFRPFLSLLMMGDVANEISIPVSQWNVVSDAANTGTFLTSLYIEGGPAFCFLGSFIYGLIVNIIYHQFRSSLRLSWKFLYVSVLFPWTWLFFTNAFSVLSVYINLLYVLVLANLCVRRKSRKRFDSRFQAKIE